MAIHKTQLCWIMEIIFIIKKKGYWQWVTRRMSCKNQKLRSIRCHLGSSPILLVRFVLFNLLISCVVCLCLVCLRSVWCAKCCPCFWIVHSWLSRFSLTFFLLKISSYENTFIGYGTSSDDYLCHKIIFQCRYELYLYKYMYMI